MNVLSLFDGCSCGQLALSRAGIKVDNYYASEIDKHAIAVTMHNFPNTIQLGDIRGVKASDLPKIDLLMGGSPCQGFSSSGKMLNFDDPRSALFFEYVRILKELREINPEIKFLLENVKMKKEWVAVISEILGVEPVEINSARVSAQNRKRLYWANFPISQPADRGILLKDILEDGTFPNPARITGRKINSEGKRDDYNPLIPIIQCLEVKKNKSNCLTTVAKDNVLTNLPIGRYPGAFQNKDWFRYYTQKELCRLQTIPEDYFFDLPQNKVTEMIGNGWTIEVIVEILKNGL